MLVPDNTWAFLACTPVPSMAQPADDPSSVGVDGGDAEVGIDVAEQSFERIEVVLAEMIAKLHSVQERLEVEPKEKEVLQGNQLHQGYRARRCIVHHTCKCREGRIDKGCCERRREEEDCA